MMRGVAAFLVMAGHLRAFVFTSYTENMAAIESILTKGFYLTTGLGHQAVVTFFALSGFLVGGKALRDIASGRFSWGKYTSRRLTRLWIVIVPVLLLTLLLDWVGISFTGGMGYGGQYFEIFNSGPRLPSGVVHDSMTFLGNLFFLQTIAVPTFGSNGPMWSLANEFWYYVTCPLAAWLVFSDSRIIRRMAGATGLILLVVVLPPSLLLGGIIWASGALAYWSQSNPNHHGLWMHPAMRFFAILSIPIAFILSKFPESGFGDLALGLTIAVALPVLALLPSRSSFYAVVSRASSEISYTLYLSHFPLFALITFTWLGPSRFSPGPGGAIVYATMLVIAIIWACLLWWCFERHTDRVYALVQRLSNSICLRPNLTTSSK